MPDELAPAIETWDAAEARERWDELLERVCGGTTRVVVERDGAPVAVLVSPLAAARLKRVDENRAELFRVIRDIQQAFADVPEDELEREVARAVEEARREIRLERERGAREG